MLVLLTESIEEDQCFSSFVDVGSIQENAIVFLSYVGSLSPTNLSSYNNCAGLGMINF